ncbi:alpha/beta hydrolase [Pseudomonas sp. RIT-PI-AD]|uniref:alpha/beta fold hydrolase n=1 Tax=Pseudomonas sp. RIT-PI-AD TaxID=3035294 RepID=UPI0021DAEAC9|nr:alpha/beta hydrolase [Pseudomonas sp. RIT-PI-AD]
MNWCEANGMALRYEVREGDGPTLVLIHEMGGSLESWDAVCAALPDFRLLRYDTRCAGLSQKIVGAVSVDEHVDDLRALLDVLGIEGPLALAGVAVGAAIAIRFASRHPQRVGHLVGLAPACGVAAAAREGALQRAALIRREGLVDTVAQLLEKTWPAPLRSDPQRYATFRLRWQAGDPQGFAAIFAMLADMDLEADLPRLPRRTLLVAGEYDGLRPPAEIDRLAGFNRDIEALHVASGHFMSVQSPRLVATLLRGFIRDDAGGAELYRAFMADPAHRLGASGHAA